MDRLRLDIDDGKYTIVQPENGLPYVLRYGEPWLSELPAGANCWMAMAHELAELRAWRDARQDAQDDSSLAQRGAEEEFQ